MSLMDWPNQQAVRADGSGPGVDADTVVDPPGGEEIPPGGEEIPTKSAKKGAS